MSKSDPDPKSRISLSDPPDDIVKKLKKAVTDFISEVTFDPENRPGVSNLISIHSFVTGQSISEICTNSENINTGQYKLQVAEVVVSHLQPIQRKISYFLDNKDFLLKILDTGAEKAAEISEKSIEEVKLKMGLLLEAKKYKQNVKL